MSSCAPDNDQESFKSGGPQSPIVLFTRRRTAVTSCWPHVKELMKLLTCFKKGESSHQYFKSKVNMNVTECDLKLNFLMKS